ncbi:MAG: DUF1232 domain-containing protein [Prevotellaceae bacterium]|nr:DUF1232 domain-containing protein [Prevotellaceae bacterium]
MENTTALVKYEKHFSQSKLLEKLKKVAQKAGAKVVYSVLLLFYVLVDGNVSIKDRAIIIGALGYFIFPVDLMPDLMLALGYTDDLAMVLFSIGKIRKSITPEIELKAKSKLQEYFNVADI